uniref:DUF4220 domain-containing protein n=1 Tax=Arundo donax TaxID=35708 RepID=A0A0A9DCE8_ARUDO
MPLDRNRISLPLALGFYNKTWCDQIASQYSTRASSGKDDTMTMKMRLMFTVVLMALMGSTLFINGFLHVFAPRFTLKLRLFLGRYNLEPVARILLHFAFFQFLPLLSSVSSYAEAQDDTELLLILLWMLLVELIRKKVQRIMLPTDGSSFSRGIGRFTLMDYSDEASRLVWVGYLIYSNMGRIHYHSLDAMFVILWSLGLVKLVQRVVNVWVASSSWHTARNPLLIAGYMQQLMEEEEVTENQSGCPDYVMSTCKFVVMGEDELVAVNKEERQKREEATLKLVTTPGYGYGVGKGVMPQDQAQGHYCNQNEQKQVHLLMKMKTERLVTVGKIWKMHDDFPKLFSDKRRKHLEDVCLAFSLFKMLRRRFEHYPMVEVGSAMARKVMLRGLLGLKSNDHNDKAQRPFQVLQLELEFLKNYYQQAAAPVVMSQPYLFFCNSASSVIFLLIFVAAFLYILFRNKVAAVLYCVTMGLASNPPNFPSIYLSITMLLVLTVIAIETYEFWTLFVFSNWNIVRLLCTYSLRGRLLQKFFSLHHRSTLLCSIFSQNQHRDPTGIHR